MQIIRVQSDLIWIDSSDRKYYKAYNVFNIITK